MFVYMLDYPPNAAPQRLEKDRLSLALSKMRKIYSDNLIEMVEWCMALDPLARPQSVYSLVKELDSDAVRRFSEASFTDKLKTSFTPEPKAAYKITALSRIFRSDA